LSNLILFFLKDAKMNALLSPKFGFILEFSQRPTIE